MSNKYYTSFYIEDGVINYPTVNKPKDENKVLAKLLADGPFLDWLNEEIKEQTELGTEDSKDSFKGRWNAYQMKRIRSKYLGIMNGMVYDEAYDDAINKLWIPVNTRCPVVDDWYVVTIDGEGYGEENRTIDIIRWSDGKWADVDSNVGVYAWLDLNPYNGVA